MRAYPKLQTAVPLADYQLLLGYENGEQRLYNFKPNLNHKFYRPLADARLFKTVSVTDGEIEWATGQDFCPHTLYNDSAAVPE